MLWLKSKKAKETGIPQRANELLIGMVKDLENTRDVYKGYSYVRTMRNILIGKEDAAIAPFFDMKPYYGQFYELSLEELEQMMDVLVKTNQLRVFVTEHGKLYCTQEYYEYLCMKR